MTQETDLTPTAEESELIRAMREKGEAARSEAEVIIDEDGNETSTAVAVPDANPYDIVLADEKWEHEILPFAGEDFHVRAPSEQALTAFALVSSKYVDERVKANIVGMFIVKHLSPATYTRVMERLIDPDDPDMTPASVGQLVAGLSVLNPALGKNADKD